MDLLAVPRFLCQLSILSCFINSHFWLDWCLPRSEHTHRNCKGSIGLHSPHSCMGRRVLWLLNLQKNMLFGGMYVKIQISEHQIFLEARRTSLNGELCIPTEILMSPHGRSHGSLATQMQGISSLPPLSHTLFFDFFPSSFFSVRPSALPGSMTS